MAPDAAEPLIVKLRDRDAVVRRQAARQLGTAKLKEGVHELAQVLAGDPSTPVRRAAAEALGRIGDAAALRPLERALRSERDDAVRGAVAAALARLGGSTGDYPGILPVSEE